MINVEEAKEKLLNDCKIVTSCSWSEDRKKFDVQHWNLSVIKTIKLINELYDSFEAQLSSNTLQLTCETCNYFSWDGRGIGQCHNCSPQCPRYTLTDFGCIFHTKNTK